MNVDFFDLVMEREVGRCLLTGDQENQHLWWTKDEVLQWSIAAQKQAGYLIDHPFLGYCDETDPITNFRANEKA